jgi:hypothetical protein
MTTTKEIIAIFGRIPFPSEAGHGTMRKLKGIDDDPREQLP